MGSAGDRIGHKKALVVVFTLAVVALLWLQPARDLRMFYLFAVVFGFAYGGLVVLELPITAELFGLRAHGAIFGIIHFGATTGGAISPLLTGRIFDITGNYQLAFLVFAAVSFIGLMLSVRLTKVEPGYFTD